jgi:hypothetical protein
MTETKTKLEQGTIDWYIQHNLVHSIHNSGAKSYQGCRRRWDWIYHGRYYPTITAKPLEFGVAMHAGMEKLYDPLTWHDKELRQALALGTFTQTVDKQYLEFRKKHPELINAETTADYQERKTLGLDMLRYYSKHIADVADLGLTPIKVEVEFEVQIKGPNGETLWCKCDRCWEKQVETVGADMVADTLNRMRMLVGVGVPYCACVDPENEHPWESWREEHWKGLPVTFGGRIDCLMMDQFGRYWIYDWKTAARMSTTEEFLFTDTQITGYCWALWSIGVPIAGFIYAEMKKAVPVEPEPHKKGQRRLGLLYSVSKSMDTTAELYEQTVKENDNYAYTQGLYDDFIAHLKSENGPRFHQRFQINRNVNELRNFGIDIYNIASEMVDPNIKIYPAPGKFNCQNCAFFDPCLSKNRGEDYMYTLETLYDKRARHYYETTKSTETNRDE